MWYREGTVTLTNGSKVVTGNAPAVFTDNVKAGNILVVAEALLEVSRRTGVAELELAVEYSGVSGTYPYVVINTIVGATNVDTAMKISEFLNTNNAVLESFSNWINGAYNGGPGGDGIFPVVDRVGQVTMCKSPKRLAKDVETSIGALGSASIPANEFPLEEYFQTVNTQFLEIRDAILAAGNIAEKWANAPVGEAVGGIGFSAKHWAYKAQELAGRAEAAADSVNTRFLSVSEKEAQIKLDRIAVNQDRTAVAGIKTAVETTKGQVDSAKTAIDAAHHDIDVKYAAVLGAASSLTSGTTVNVPSTLVGANGAVTVATGKSIASGMLLLQVAATPSSPTTMYEIAIFSGDKLVYEAKGIMGAAFLDQFSVFALAPGALSVRLKNRGNAAMNIAASFVYSSLVVV